MHTLDDLRGAFRRVGAVLTIVSAALTAAFGWWLGSNLLMCILLAGGLALATFASAYVWPFVMEAWRQGPSFGAVMLTAFAVVCTGTDCFTNFGSVSWQRTTEINTAKFQNTKGELAAKSEAGSTSRLAFLEGELAKLPWTPTISPDALNAKDEAIRQESARGGCGPKCLKLKEERAAIASQIDTAEKRADLDKQIAQLREVVRTERDKVADSPPATSAGLLQNIELASMFTFSLDPTEAAQHWTHKGVNWMVALFFALGAMGCNAIGFGAFSPSKRRETFPPRAAGGSEPAPTRNPLEDFIANLNRHVPQGLPKFA